MNLVFIVISILFIIPVLYIISVSFTPDTDIVHYGYRLIPKNFSTMAYEFMFKSPKQLINAYGVSVFVTIFGTLVSLLFTTMLAYTIARPDYKYRKFVSFFIFFTMLFNGGLVPTYILMTRYLHLKNNILVLVLPYIINAWYVLLMKGFISTLPLSLVESAKIDGSNEYRTFFSIILPLAKPALATVGLLIAFNYWNDWWLSLLYIDVERLIPLQYLLYRTMANITYITQILAATVHVDLKNIPTESARMTMCILAAGPMLLVFPFFQKYFVKGITLGAVKG